MTKSEFENIQIRIRNMLIKPQTRRCLRCGHSFTYMRGDLIFELFPKCPKCSSHLTCKSPFI